MTITIKCLRSGSNLRTAVAMLAAGAFLASTALRAVCAEEKSASDWPQFMGPNRTGVASSGPKLLDAWPKDGLRLLWTSDPLPPSPSSGIGSPVVAGGNVFTFSNTLLPMAGTCPFNAEFLNAWGWAPNLPEELGKKVDAAQFNDPKRKACKSPEEVEAFTKEFLASLDAEQAKKFGDAIRIRMQCGGQAFNSNDLAWMASQKNTEATTREAYWKLCKSHFPENMFHYWLGPLLVKCADKIYANQQSSDTIYCLSATTGKELWRKELTVAKAPYAPGNGVSYGFSGTPAIIKDKLYFAGSGGVYCLDLAKKGALVWQGKGEPSHTSPLILNGVAYFMAGELAAFNAETGAELWRQPKIKNTFSSPAAWTHEGKTYLLCTYGTPDPIGVACIDPASGNVLWQAGVGMALNATPVTSGEYMVVRGKGGAVGFKISPQKAEQLWKSDAGDAGSSAVIYQDYVYLCGRTYNRDLVVVLDLKTGAVKMRQASVNSPTCATPIVTDGKVYTLEAPVGSLIAFKATPDKFELVGSMAQVKAADCSSPAIADGKIFLRLANAIVCYDLAGK